MDTDKEPHFDADFKAESDAIEIAYAKLKLLGAKVHTGSKIVDILRETEENKGGHAR
ncbi:MAG: hypothetical protein JOZ32_19115 [Bryobacterales bacterium]|nr:hypothetical protein [Bryobacterales bacterium]